MVFISSQIICEKEVNNLSYQSMKKLMCLRNVFFIKCLSINSPNTKNNENKIKTEREKRNIKKTLISQTVKKK